MEAFNQLTGIAAPFPEANTDTDVIMPKQFLKGIDRQNLDRGVFFDRRFLASGELNPAFVLNRPEYRNASFLVVGPNFGCGSSREHAVWGLKQLGIRALIGTSFAGIFDDNCRQNGLVTITLAEPQYDELLAHISDASPELTVSLAECTISGAGWSLPFTMSELKRAMLMGGEDAIGWTLNYREQIDAFEAQHFTRYPWLKRPQAQA